TRAGLLLMGPPLTHVLMNLGEEMNTRGDWAAARPFYERQRDLLERLIAESPRVPDYRDQLRIALFRLSRIDLGSGRLDDAEGVPRRVLAWGEEILRNNPDLAILPPRMTRLARLGSEHRDLAAVLEAQGRIPEAISFYAKGISILEEAIQRQPLDV